MRDRDESCSSGSDTANGGQGLAAREMWRTELDAEEVLGYL